jgi:hypothetical protein
MRRATAARLALGGVCLVDPARMLGVIGGPDREDARTRLITRVLGVRLVVQATADLALGPRTRVPDVLVDGTHAASMVVAARRWPVHRRSALVSVAAATVIAMLDLTPRTHGELTGNTRAEPATHQPGQSH